MARKYRRDNRGRFAAGGGGATARGGRLKTASGKKRATVTAKAKGPKMAGAVKGKVRRDPAAASKIGKAAPTRSQTLQARADALRQQANQMMNLGGGRRDGAVVNVSLNSGSRAGSIDRGLKGLQMMRQANRLSERARNVEIRAQQSAAKRAREAAKPKKTRSPDSLRLSRAKQIEKRRGMKLDWLPEPTLAKRASNSARVQAAAIAIYKKRRK